MCFLMPKKGSRWASMSIRAVVSDQLSVTSTGFSTLA
jgi:hypothetical protein